MKWTRRIDEMCMRKAKSIIICLTFKLAALFISQVAIPLNACSVQMCIDHGVEMRSSFFVYLHHDGKPLPGVHVAITRNDQTAFEGQTGLDGKLHVNALRPGDYWITASLLGIQAATHCFHVKPSSTIRAKRSRRYEFGEFDVITRSVTGKILEIQEGSGGSKLWNLTHPTDVPIRNARFKIENIRTREQFHAMSNEDGSFVFPALAEGTYVLNVTGGSGTRPYDPTDIPLVVSTKALYQAVTLSSTFLESGCNGRFLESKWR